MHETGQRRHHYLHEALVQQTVMGRAGRGDREASDVPHAAPLVRDAPAGGWERHPDRSGAPRTPGRRDDDDLHARSEPWPGRRPEPGGSPLRRWNVTLRTDPASRRGFGRRNEWAPRAGGGGCPATWPRYADLSKPGRLATRGLQPRAIRGLFARGIRLGESVIHRPLPQCGGLRQTCRIQSWATRSN